MRKTLSAVTGFENSGREPQVKECGQPLKLEKTRKQIIPQNLQKGMQLYQHFDFSLVRSMQNY